MHAFSLMTPSRGWGLVAAAVVLGGGWAACGPPGTSSEAVPGGVGAVVVSLTPNGAADLYGVAAGDVLVGWRGSGSGAIDGPLAARRVEVELAPAGGVELRVWRGGDEIVVPVASGKWDLELRPVLDTELVARERAARGQLDEAPGEAAAGWLRLAETLEGNGAASATAAWYRHLGGRAWARAGEVGRAERELAAGRELLAADDSLAEAVLLQLEARAWRQARDAPRAKAAALGAIDIRHREVPDSVAEAMALSTLARTAPLPVPFEEELHRALEILERLAPNSLEHAEVLSGLGSAAFYQSELDRGSVFYEEALRVQQQALPGYYRIANSYHNLGLVAAARGRLDDAEELFERALREYGDDRLMDTASTASSLGLVHRDKGDYRAAQQSLNRALAAYRAEVPESLYVAGVLNNLANQAQELGDLERAEALNREALALRRQLAPGSRWVAASLNNLGGLAQSVGRLSEARSLLAEALEIKEGLAPGTLTHSNTLVGLAQLSHDEGRIEEAERLFREALEIRRSVDPGTLPVVESLVLLGRFLVDTGRGEEGEAVWRQGLDLLDETRVGFRFSALERSVFGSVYQEEYRDLASVLIERARPEEAFALLERSRARGLRVMAAQRPNAQTGQSVSSGASPELPALTLEAVRSRLDGGTRLVLFSVAADETHVAVIARGESGIRFHRVPVERGELERDVDLFRALIARGRDQETVEPALLALGQRLYRTLLAPVADELEGAERIVVLPDVPLYLLPFSALVRSAEPLQFVGEWKPLSFAVSATQLAAVRERPPASGSPPRVAVFARTEVGDVDLPGPPLPPLPGARREAGELAALFGSAASLYLDEGARESEVTNGAGSADYLHFATHAVLDSRRPLESALVLAPGGGEDGLLHAWEVIEGPALTSDLVTLSACNTGVGRELGGEGVLGLSHAFLFAGVPTVLTSLWPVSDAATSDWMSDFYGGLAQGLDRDVAVLRAQRQAMRGGAQSRHPIHWAAFQLWGDWGRGAG